MTRAPHRWATAFLAGGLTVLAVVLVVSSVYLSAINQAMSTVERADPLPSVAESRAMDAPDDLNLLFVVTGDQGRLEALLVGHLSQRRDRLGLVAIPPELMAPDGAPLSSADHADSSIGVASVQSWLGVSVNHRIVVDLPSFLGLADDLGGISVPGAVGRVGGAAEAQAYLDSVRGAAPRLQRVTQLVVAVLRKLTAGSSLTNPAMLAQVANRLGTCVVLDRDLTPAVVQQLAMELRLTGDGIRRLAMPVSRGSTPGVLLPEPHRLRILANALRADDVAGYLASVGDGWSAVRELLPR